VDTYLILHHRIADILNQTIKCTRIIDVVEKTLNRPLLCQWLEFSENIFQFPDDSCLSDQTWDFGECRLTVPASLSVLAHWHHP